MVSPMPSASSVAMPAVALTRPAGRRPGLGDAEVQRVVGDLGQLAVGLDHQRHVRRLDRDLHVVEADLVEVGQLQLGRLDHRLGRDPAAVLLVEVGVERAAVDADADGHAPVLGLRRPPALMCSGLRMLPGLRRRQCTPASRAASAMRYWWWMSATIGTGERGTIGPGPRPPPPRCRCSARCRRRPRPGRRSAGSVPSTSAVLVIVIDCTDDRRVAADRHRRRRGSGGSAGAGSGDVRVRMRSLRSLLSRGSIGLTMSR